ncbi:hypothetical protein KPL71_014218 [Citrus sinensis]|uniref:Uncharacterized protein n=1 Tax=Citrus sinensis TaxID=2711 RepID=A0ACB8KA89_CITSI|nr:hypothetical protein KPL71_014218 [Citrus sinensis]
MVEAIVSIALELLNSSMAVVGGIIDRQELKKLKENFEAIHSMLLDTEEEQTETMKQPRGRVLWVQKLKEASYDLEDVLDELITSRRNRVARKERGSSILDIEMGKLNELENDPLAPLLLSYNDFPPMIKLCFLYCAVFPKDYNIEKDELIKLWMAQGYIRPIGNKEMEVIGQEYFDYLATRSFFQKFDKDDEDNVTRCKMSDAVHDFAQFLTKHEYFSIEADGSEESLTKTSLEKFRHSILVLGRRASFPVSIFKAKKLRSLLIHSEFEVSFHVLQGLFDYLTCLRALKITGKVSWGQNSIYAIPKEKEKLVHLRYLKLSLLLMREELPDIVCELFNLQTLEVEHCPRLKRLPQGIGKLVNLRHLICYYSNLDYMPKGFERLTCLRTLTVFVVSGGKYSGKACNIEGLRHLNHLGGVFRITGLGNVTDVDEAENAELEKKRNVVDLGLWFDKDEEGEEADHEEIIEALKPHSNLVALDILGFKGKITFPKWIMSLNNLKSLHLRSCEKCEILPPLGKLPSLETLYIAGMSGKRVEWGFGITQSNVKEDVMVMPCLNYLDIQFCFKLKALPGYLLEITALEKLEILCCPIFEQRYRKGTGEDWSKVAHVPTITINRQYVQGISSLRFSI